MNTTDSNLSKTSTPNMVQGTILHESKYAKHIYQEDKKTMFTYWFAETAEMDETEFKQEMEQWLAASQQCKPKFIYDLCREFIYPISPDEQVWLAHLLNTPWIEVGVEKYAHIVPEELIANISTMQLFEEFDNMDMPNQFIIRHFSDDDEALTWLLK